MHQIRKTSNLILFAAIMTIGLALSADAQAPLGSALPGISYDMQQSNGTNASAVAWNSKMGLYYTVIAGNKSFPLETFDAKGKPVSETKAGFDFRGLWWDSKKQKLYGNGEGDHGWCEAITGSDGRPSGVVNVLKEGENQPDNNSVGAYDAKKKRVVFYNSGVLYVYHAKKIAEMTTMAVTDLPVSINNINTTTVGYTGKKGYEFALLDHKTKKVYYVNRKGAFTGATSLPADAVTSDRFRWSFANGHAWLYDVDTRSWQSYRVF